MAFSRSFSSADINAVKEEELFTKFLLPDIDPVSHSNTGKTPDVCVYPAVRDGRMDFYHRGGKVFSYDRKKGFTTHEKYASVLMWDKPKDYVGESEVAGTQSITTFAQTYAYERIKENCALYAGLEAEAVSHLYSTFSAATRSLRDSIVVLDIEVSFESKTGEEQPTPGKPPRQDRIDLLLFDTASRALRFVEAKQFKNGEIRAKEEKIASGDEEEVPDRVPSVVGQIERYQAQLAERTDEVLGAYSSHVAALNELFGTSLPAPVSVGPKVGLYVFGFDGDQKNGRLARNVNSLTSRGVSVYALGNPKKVSINTLWNAFSSK